MKKPYCTLSIERLQNAVNNHTQSVMTSKAFYDEQKKVFDNPRKKLKPSKDELRKLYLRMKREESRLKQAKYWLQKRTDERDMKNH